MQPYHTVTSKFTIRDFFITAHTCAEHLPQLEFAFESAPVRASMAEDKDADSENPDIRVLAIASHVSRTEVPDKTMVRDDSIRV